MSTLKKIKVMSERLPELGEVSSVVTGITLELKRSHNGIAARQRKQLKGPEAGQSLPCSRYQKDSVARRLGRRCNKRWAGARMCRTLQANIKSVQFIFIAMESHWTLSEAGRYLSENSLILCHIS